MIPSMRRLLTITETFYRGTRRDPEKTLRPSLSFTDDPDVASVYASEPGKDAYGAGAQVAKANFDLKRPVDLEGPTVTLYDAFVALGVDPTDHEDDVLKLIAGLMRIQDRGRSFYFDTLHYIEFIDHLSPELRRLADRNDWSSFTTVLEQTTVDAYAICDTATYTRLAKEQGFDGFKYVDSFDIGAKVAPKLLGKDKPNTHVTYRPFGSIRWGS